MEFLKYDSGVSVVVPTYNNAHFLTRCLASIKSQTHPVDEIVIVDDGSTDSTDALLSDLCDQMPNIVCVRQVNQGESGARNRGLAIARHGIVAFLDADDTWTPVHIEECCEAFKLFPDIALAVAKYELRDETKNSCEDEQVIYSRRDSIKHIPGMIIKKSGNNFLMSPESMLHNIIMDRICFHTSSLVINRHRLNGTFNFDLRLRFGADLDFVCGLLFHGAKPLYIDNLHTLYYIHSSNTVRTVSDTPAVACEKMQRSTAHKEKQLIYCRTYEEYDHVLECISNTYWVIACLLSDMARYAEAHKYFQLSYRLIRRFTVFKHILAYSLVGEKGMPYLVGVLGWFKRVLSKAKKSSQRLVNYARTDG